MIAGPQRRTNLQSHQDSPRADSSRSYLNNYWDNFSSNNGQRQVAIG